MKHCNYSIIIINLQNIIYNVHYHFDSREILGKLSMTSVEKTGLVIWTMGHQARVLIDDERFHLDIPGKWRLELKGNRPLAPGDRVSVSHDSHGWRLLKRLPRQNEFTRRMPGSRRNIPQVMAVNLDLVIVVASVKAPRTA